jgi:hypothetical protein
MAIFNSFLYVSHRVLPKFWPNLEPDSASSADHFSNSPAGAQAPGYPPAVATSPAILLWPVPRQETFKTWEWGKTYRKTSSSISSWRYDITYLFVGTSKKLELGFCTHFQTKPCEKTSTVLAISLESRVLHGIPLLSSIQFQEFSCSVSLLPDSLEAVCWPEEALLKELRWRSENTSASQAQAATETMETAIYRQWDCGNYDIHSIIPIHHPMTNCDWVILQVHIPVSLRSPKFHRPSSNVKMGHIGIGWISHRFR